MAVITIDIQGIPELAQALQRIAVQAERAFVQALQEEAERILEASQPLVPVDTGLLVSTGLVERLHDGATMSYGGKGLAPYAAVVEFDTTMRHPNGGQSHFLQQPFFEATADMPQRLAPAVEQALRR